MFLIKLTIYKINYIDTISGCIIINTIKSLCFFLGQLMFTKVCKFISN